MQLIPLISLIMYSHIIYILCIIIGNSCNSKGVLNVLLPVAAHMLQIGDAQLLVPLPPFLSALWTKTCKNKTIQYKNNYYITSRTRYATIINFGQFSLLRTIFPLEHKCGPVRDAFCEKR